MYYELRNEFNRCIQNKELTPNAAALFIFLNKTGFNGLYRINSKGNYNVSFGKKKNICMPDEKALSPVSKLLQDKQILCGDFESACRSAQPGDFVFFDSPYYDTFDTYQKGGFSEEDHKRLNTLFKELTDRGVYCMLTNSNTEFIKDLYSDYNVEVVDVMRSISRNPSTRKDQEIIVTNYTNPSVKVKTAA